MKVSVLAGAACRIATGTYTGDGSTSLAVTGVGFRPKFVRCWRRNTAGATAVRVIETTDTEVDDNASGMAVGHTNAATVHTTLTDAIIAIGDDGFTVDDAGTDSDPNSSGVTYNYLCLG